MSQIPMHARFRKIFVAAATLSVAFWLFSLSFRPAADTGLRAEAQAGPPALSIPDFPETPVVQQRGQLSRLVLRRPGSDQKFSAARWLAAAPRDYAGAAALKIPDGAALFALRTPTGANSAGQYEGPDGGRVIVWAADFYRWERHDGVVFTTWPDGAWNIELAIQNNSGATHRIHRHGGQAANQLEWQFPDGAEIQRIRVRDARRYEWYYEREDGDELVAYQLWPLYREAGQPHLKAQMDRLQISYDRSWQPYMDVLQNSQVVTGFLKFAQSHLNLRNAGPIPVALFRDLNSFRQAGGDANRQAGGAGGLHGVAACCGAQRPAPAKDDTIRAARAAAESHHVLFHELIHNLTANRCRTVRGREQLPASQHPGHWFVEGVADYMVMQTLPRERVWMYSRFYEYVDRGAIPDFAQLDYSELRAYTFGRLMLQYLLENEGAASFQEYYDATCRGVAPDQAMRAAADRTPAEVYRESVQYFRERRARIEAQYFDWQLDGLYTIDYEFAREPRPDRNAKLPYAVAADLFAIDSVPDITRAFRVQAGSLRSPHFEGFVRTPDQRRVFFWRGGEVYRVEAPAYQAFVRDEEVSLEFSGHRIINWANGQRRWVWPDGRYFHMWSAEQPAGFFDKNDKPISAP